MLTGLRNRRGFLDAAPSLLRDDQMSVIALVDLDHFKMINDRFGHEEGDQILRTFSARLKDGLRRLDLVGRWGGEEFAIVLPDTDLEQAEEIINRLREALRAEAFGAAQGHPVTFSCRLAITRSYKGIDEAMRKADAALYKAKAAARDQVTSLA